MPDTAPESESVEPETAPPKPAAEAVPSDFSLDGYGKFLGVALAVAAIVAVTAIIGYQAGKDDGRDDLIEEIHSGELIVIPDLSSLLPGLSSVLPDLTGPSHGGPGYGNGGPVRRGPHGDEPAYGGPGQVWPEGSAWPDNFLPGAPGGTASNQPGSASAPIPPRTPSVAPTHR